MLPSKKGVYPIDPAPFVKACPEIKPGRRKIRTHIIFLLTVFALFSQGCSVEELSITNCEPSGLIRPVCEMLTPEDIAALPDGKHLLLVNFGGMFSGTGYLSLFNTVDESSKILFPSDQSLKPPNESWGDNSCPPPEISNFRPHGSHLHQLKNGRWRYLVINHGSRESIELFEAELNGYDTKLIWRGCVLAGKDTIMNDVVGLSDGDLIFTRMFHTEPSPFSRIFSVLGFTTGDVWRWNKEDGLRILTGTNAAEPNGIEISADEKYIYANMYFEGEVWKIDATKGGVAAKVKIASPDNSAWSKENRLWVASHTGSIMEQATCLENQSKPCGASFEIIELNTETMETSVVFSQEGPPMGAATVAVPQGKRVYMGSFVGDRLISAPLSEFVKK